MWLIGNSRVEEYSMAIDIDWIARLRTVPSEVCPPEDELQDFVKSPEGVSPASFAHIIRGCPDCRAKLQEMVLHPDKAELKRFLRSPDKVDEEIVLHCMSCKVCRSRVQEILDD